MEKKKCELCGGVYPRPPFLSNKRWEKRRFCNFKCKEQWWGENVATRKGRKFYRDQRGDKNFSWKGNDIGYNGIHSWVKRNFIRPVSCEICGKLDNSSRRLSWASKQHNYTRDIKD